MRFLCKCRQEKFFTFFFLLSIGLYAQTFDIDQIEQVFRPRVKWDNRYILPTTYADTIVKFSDFTSSTLITFPIRTRLDTDFKLDLSQPRLKDILKNSVRITASQTLGSLRVVYRQTQLGFDSVPTKNFYGITAGFSGVKLDRNYRVVFYNLSVNLSEENKTFSAAVPRFSGILGRLHLKGLYQNYFYGLAIVYSDGLPLPVPFFGGTFPVNKHFIFNCALPTSLNFQFKSKSTSIYTGISADGFRTGLQYKNQRVNLNHIGGQLFVMWRQKIHRTITTRLECGYYFYSALNFSERNDVFAVRPGPYVNAGINILFGKNFFERVLDRFQ
jgi:hypothetical protein